MRKPTLEEVKIDSPCPRCGGWGFHRCQTGIDSEKGDELE
jgi:hypothetical protein